MSRENSVRVKINPPEGDPLYKKALLCLQILRKKGYESYFAGGCVRDILMEKKPKDYDITTNARPEDVIKIFPKVFPVGAQFGVVRVRIRGMEVEVATFRKDGLYIDGRHPENVQFSSAREDVERRDFTINGLLFDPVAGEVIDYVGGIDDIKKKIIKTIGDPKDRFGEDRLRMIRAIRFSANFGFVIDEKSFNVIKEEYEKILDVSFERIRDEIIKIFEENNPDIGIRLLEESGILKTLIPEVMEEGKLPRWKKDIFNLWEGGNYLIGWTILTAGISKKEKVKIFEKLCFSNKEKKAILKINEIEEKLHFLQRDDIAEQKRLLREKFIKEALSFYELKLIQQGSSIEFIDFLNKRFSLWKKEDIYPQKIIDGNGLKKLGIKEGPIYREILESIENEQLRGNIKTYEECINYIKKNYLTNEPVGGN